MRIITLTLNPAFDVHLYSKNFKPYHESVAEIISREAGGKGINVSRALNENGYKNLAVVAIGRENGEEFLKALTADGVDYCDILVDGRIRENFTLHEDNNPETRISFDGFTCKKELLYKIEAMLGEDLLDTIVTFTGSIPKGLDSLDAINFLNRLKLKGAKVVVDCRSFSLEDLLKIKPWLIKPNKDEAENYLQKSLSCEKSAIDVSEYFYKKGIENVIISLGEMGAVLSCADGNFYANAPKIQALSTIGAGDSMIAGFIAGYVDGLSSIDCLKNAVAFGSSACLREGTLPPTKEIVKSILLKVTAK